MPVDAKRWAQWRERWYRRIWEDIEVGYLDRDILPLLEAFFRCPHYYTISSCSGRAVVVDAPYPWSRKDSGILLKKHEPLTVEDIENALQQPVVYTLWLNVQGPILHVSADSIKWAVRLLKAARKAGFKHSGVLSFSRDRGIIVELRTGVRMIAPLKVRDKVLVKDLDLLVSEANRILAEGKRRLEKLLRAVEEELAGAESER